MCLLNISVQSPNQTIGHVKFPKSLYYMVKKKKQYVKDLVRHLSWNAWNCMFIGKIYTLTVFSITLLFTFYRLFSSFNFVWYHCCHNVNLIFQQHCSKFLCVAMHHQLKWSCEKRCNLLFLEIDISNVLCIKEWLLITPSNS